MPTRFRIPLILFRSTLTALLMAGMGVAPAFAAQARSAPAAPAAPPPATDQELQATQEQLIKLLRLSPTLTTVVEHDPTLLSNQEYVNRNNPQLAQFLGSHPEVARNPEFYLFTHLNTEGGRDEALERAVWPELNQGWHPPTPGERIMDNVIPFLVFLGILLGLLWLTRQLLENRRWGRIFKLQTDVHSKLIERFGSNQELMTYIGTDAGKRFLEGAPISVGLGPEQRMPNAVARVLTPLQIGVVLTLLGVGLLAIRNNLGADMISPMLLMGVVVLMPGIGFIISAGITWLLAARLGLMPEQPSVADRQNLPFDPREPR
ncbi:MAG TPA: hypothetical protein VLZ50_08290 [Terracidiphilus sp.]|nr:hypothetical protein [Terracidiphilus sp.]